MYRVLYFLVLCGFARSAPQTESSVVKPVLAKCLAELDLTTDYHSMNCVRNLTESIIRIIVEPKARRLVGCTWRENKWLRNDYNPTEGMEKIPQESQKFKEAINECGKETDEDPCEMVFKFFMCYNAKMLADIYVDPIVASSTPYTGD